MKKILLFAVTALFINLSNAQNDTATQVATTLDSWHKAASDADYHAYFNLMADDAIFIGTDATENWTKPAFQAYAKPHFDKGKAWRFTSLERHIYFNSDKTLAWFDELLDTQMKICRGSGVLVLLNGQWKIKQYVLSMTIPNDISDEIIKVKSPIEEALVTELKNKKR